MRRYIQMLAGRCSQMGMSGYIKIATGRCIRRRKRANAAYRHLLLEKTKRKARQSFL
jgi:hypothetical protein